MECSGTVIRQGIRMGYYTIKVYCCEYSAITLRQMASVPILSDLGRD